MAAILLACILSGGLSVVTAPFAQAESKAQTAGREAVAGDQDSVSIAVGNVIGEWAVLYEYDEIPLTPELGRGLRKDRAIGLRPSILRQLKKKMAARRRFGDARITLRIRTRGSQDSAFRELKILKEGGGLIFQLPPTDELAQLKGMVGLKLQPKSGYFHDLFWFWATRVRSTAVALGILPPGEEFYLLKGRYKDPWPLIRDSGRARRR